MAKILISPYSRKMRTDKQNPKNYPWWKEVVEMLRSEGHHITQLGIEQEQRIDNVDDVLWNVPVMELPSHIRRFDVWMSVDNFLPHMCYSMKVDVPGIVIFGISDPLIFGYDKFHNLLKDRSLLREHQFDIWETAEFSPTVFVAPEEVLQTFNSIINNN